LHDQYGREGESGKRQEGQVGTPRSIDVTLSALSKVGTFDAGVASMIEQPLEIRTPDGTADVLLVRPDSLDPLPAIINLTDGFGFGRTSVGAGRSWRR
jgi:hypothetical protein